MTGHKLCDECELRAGDVIRKQSCEDCQKIEKRLFCKNCCDKAIYFNKREATLAENKRMLGKYEICCPKCHYVFSTPECPSDVYDECGCGVSNASLRLKEVK